jgi:uroporphyrinogen III methyltransferase/synthase
MAVKQTKPEAAQKKQEGRVFLVGAGPGDPGLLTVRGRELLETADVVVYDYLVHSALLEWLRPECERICVGKRPGFHSVPQEEIETLLVKHASNGKRVVRLKGGDPFIFGRGGEEARKLSQDGVLFEIVPGVTASLATGAYAGIPLTHRETAATVVFATGHEDPEKTAATIDWAALAKLRGATLCIYMGMGHLAEILGKLQAGGLSADTPAACVMWASLGHQHTVTATVATLADEVTKAGLKAPAIIVIGEVVRMRETIAWFETRPLFGKRIVVTRSRHQAGALRQRLEKLGAMVIEIPLIRIERDVNEEIRKEVFAEFGTYDWLVFSSANGVNNFFATFLEEFPDLRSLGLIRIAAVGESTAKVIRNLHLSVEVVPDKPVAEELADALVATGTLDNAKVLVVIGSEGRDVLVNKLEEARAIVDCLPVYRTEKNDLTEEPGAQDFREAGADAVLFTSSSGVRSFAAQAEALQLADGAKRPLTGSIGPITSETMRSAGVPVDFEASTSTLDAFVESLVKKLAGS